MDTVTRFPERAASSVSGFHAIAGADPAPGLTVTVVYKLSEEGRKASLLAGGSGQALQRVTVQVPANRMHLVAVDRNGLARLKLQPYYELDADQRIVRQDTAPRFDAPPSLDDLFRVAARNHELGRAWVAERTALKVKRVESDREFRERVAQEFLADPTKRAVPHPIPTVKRCALTSERGALVFDTEMDQGRAREVPAEAHRRLRADERQAAAKRVHSREADLALHQEKLRYIADWVEQHGTADQRVRHAAGVLPIREVVAALEAEAFAPVGAKPLYERDGAAQLQAYLRQFPGYADVVVGRGEFTLFNTAAVKATAAQWALVQEIREALPSANVTLLEHRLRWKGDPNAPVLRLYRVLATIAVGPFILRREFVAPSD